MGKGKTVVVVLMLSLFGLMTFLLASAQTTDTKEPCLTLPYDYSAPFPMEKGCEWHYVGTVRWTQGTTVKQKQVEWTMRIKDHIRKPAAEIVYVCGHPLDLCLYDESVKPGNYLIARNRTSYYLIWLKSDNWQAVADKIRIKDGILICPGEKVELFLDQPLYKDKRFGVQVPNRSDYCWRVDSLYPVDWNVLPIKSDKQSTVFRLCFETNPDTLTFDFLPGIGIIAFTYNHHGTVADVNLRLTKVVIPSYQAK